MVAGGDKNWRDMLGEFYGRFSNSLEAQNQPNVRAELKPAKWACPECGGTTAYRLGKAENSSLARVIPITSGLAPSTEKAIPPGPNKWTSCALKMVARWKYSFWPLEIHRFGELSPTLSLC